MLEEALFLHQEGKLGEAAALYREILAQNPNRADALHLLGVVEFQSKNPSAAIALIERAIQIEPNNPAFFSNLGLALRDLNRPDDALASYDRALALQPDFANALNNRGLALQDLARLDEALLSYDRALAIRPDYADALYNRGNALRDLKRFEDGLADFDRVLALLPDFAAALNDRGTVLQALNRLDDALASYDRALAVKSDFAGALYNRGNALGELKRFDDALAAYDRALAILPDFADALNNRGLVLRELKRFDDALANYDRALALQPDSAGALSNRGVVLADLERFDEALASYERALALLPDDAEVHNNRGVALKKLKRFDEALASYDRALSIKPDYAEAFHNRGMARLLCGHYREGWLDCEWRLKYVHVRVRPPNIRAREWQGEDINGRSILIFAEQGLGDTIQFVRYLPVLLQRGARVSFLASANLVRLLRPLSTRIDFISSLEGRNPFDFQCALMSLPLRFGTDSESIPNQVPYLKPEEHLVGRWKQFIGERGFKIGIAWQGNPQGGIDQGRSFPLSEIAPLTRLPGVRLISLQKHHGLDQLTYLPAGVTVESLGNEFDGGPDAFIDTAAVMSNLDLIITADTSTAHLAGALGCPTWVALKYVPDWRWLLDRNDSPWYPTMRLFRQETPGDWKLVFSTIEQELRSLLGSPDPIGGAISAVPSVPEEALSLHQEGKLGEASALYRKILAQNPNRADALHLLGVVEFQTRNPSAAIELIERAIQIEPNNAAFYSNLGLVLADLRRLDDALAIYDRALALQPDFADALNNRGLVLQELNRFHDALGSYDRALALQPDYADALYNRGNLLSDLKHFEEALASYDRVLALLPDFAEALNNRGNALRELKRFDDAVASYDRALALKPDFAEALNDRGLALQDLKRFDDALASYDRALAVKPDYAEALNERGLVLRELKRVDDALASFDQALALVPGYARALNNRGIALQELGRLDDALVSFERALAIKPDFAAALNNRGFVLQELKRFDDALASCDRALAFKPDYAEALNNRGIALQELNRLDDALDSYDRALAIRPDFAGALNNRGTALKELKRLDDAVASYNRALAIRPDYAEALDNRGTVRLLRGHYREGWADNEWRWKTKDFSTPSKKINARQWQGEDPKGRSILIVAEQGLGDVIQFVRYLPLLVQRGARVTFGGHTKLVRLLGSLGAQIEIISSLKIGTPFDFHCALLSLPLWFKTDADSIPHQVPYLRAEADLVAKWKTRIGDHGFKVGIAWQGNPSGKIDRGRSIPLAEFVPLSRLPSVRLISLQKQHGLDQLAGLPPHVSIEVLDEDFDGGPDAFIDTAAVMENLDLIITSDTAIAHLAGALARPTWVALKYVPDWRWLLDREDSPWYPTMRLFRQKMLYDWSVPFQDIAVELDALLAKNRG